MNQPADATVDQDLEKGAVEDGPDTLGNGNVDDRGEPADDLSVAEDVIGANEDQTQG